MRTLANLNIPKDTQARFPFGTIQNETDTQDGTPVVREIYGDVLTNIYKILQLTNEVPTGNEDSDDTQYQLVNALKRFANEINDVEKVLTVNGNIVSVDLNLQYLPNKFVFIGRATDNYNDAAVNQFRGSAPAPSYVASSPTGFNVNDEVLTVIDTAGVRMYSLTKLTSAGTAFNVLGNPISYNSTNTMYYFESGKIYTNNLNVYDIEEAIHTLQSNADLIISDVVAVGSNLIAMVYDTLTINYKHFVFDLSDLNAPPTAATYSGFNVLDGTDNSPYMFCDGAFFYFTNEFNSNAADNRISKFSFNPANNTFTLVSTVVMDGAFVKTTNTVSKNDQLYTFVNNLLNKYNLNTGAETNILSDFTLFNGMIFNFKGALFYTKGEVATEWNL